MADTFKVREERAKKVARVARVARAATRSNHEAPTTAAAGHLMEETGEILITHHQLLLATLATLGIAVLLPSTTHLLIALLLLLFAMLLLLQHLGDALLLHLSPTRTSAPSRDSCARHARLGRT
jgi:hypothetical protein